MSDVKILIVDDHPLIRDMLARRLGDENGMTVVGMAPDADAAITLARQHRPDIITMDIDMPGLICFDAARTILSFHQAVRLIFLSAFAHDHYLDQALDVGARGYVTKGDAPERIIEAIRAVADGGVSFSDEVMSRMVFDDGRVRLSDDHRSRISSLTPRELEVLTYVARGMSKKVIAETMSVSVKTIESHTQNLMRKLDIHDRVELARYAFREGLAKP